MSNTNRIPNISVTRTGTSISINVSNMRNRVLILYKALESKSGFTQLAELREEDLPYIDSVALDASPKYKAAFIDLEGSVEVLNINTEIQPYYVEFEVVPPTIGTIVTNTFNVSWGPDLVDIPIIELSNLSQGSYSQSIQTGKTI